MTERGWSFALSWSRVGINAVLFLVAARVLSLAEIGLFATAFAPVKLVQALQKAGVSDIVVMYGHRPARWRAVWAFSLVIGGAAALVLAVLGALFSPMLLALALVPLLNAPGSVPEGVLRHRLAMRALALRTLAAQGAAAVLALGLLWQGHGPWALVGFAVASAGLTSLLSVWLAGWWPGGLPRWRQLGLILPQSLQIMGRVALNTGQMPLAQIVIGIGLGPVAAGAFQIAVRLVELVDALALSPLRYVALPRLARAAEVGPALRQESGEVALLAVWIWGGVFAAAGPVLSLAVGAVHAPAAAPILQALAFGGLASALMMPVTQALVAKGQTGLVLGRAVLTLSLSAVLLVPAVTVSATIAAGALSLAGVAGHVWLLRRALPRLGLGPLDLAPVAPPLLAGMAMVLALLALPALPFWAEVCLGTGIYAAIIGLTRTPARRFA